MTNEITKLERNALYALTKLSPIDVLTCGVNEEFFSNQTHRDAFEFITKQVATFKVVPDESMLTQFGFHVIAEEHTKYAFDYYVFKINDARAYALLEEGVRECHFLMREWYEPATAEIVAMLSDLLEKVKHPKGMI